MDMVQLEQVYEDLFGKSVVQQCDDAVCFWLVVDLAQFSSMTSLHVDAMPGGDKKPRRHRPFLTAGKTNGGEFRVLLLTANKRRFAVSIVPCNKFCSDFFMKRRSYVFEWGGDWQASVALIPAGIVTDKDVVRFCGHCPKSFVLPKGVLNECFVP